MWLSRQLRLKAMFRMIYIVPTGLNKRGDFYPATNI